MRRIAALSAAFLLTCLAAPARALPGFEAGVRGTYWFPDLSATAQSTTAGVVETRFDVKDDLGVGDEDFLSGEAFVRFGRTTFRLGYLPVRFDGSQTLTRSIVFGGQTFSVSDNVISRLDVTLLNAELQVDVLRPDLVAANFRIGLIGKVEYVDGEVELSGSVASEKEDFRLPIPMVGLAAEAGFLGDRVRVDARVTGMAYSGNHLYEADVFASVAPFPFFRLQGGYRFIDLSVDEDDVEVDLELKGPYVGVRFSF